MCVVGVVFSHTWFFNQARIASVFSIVSFKIEAASCFGFLSRFESPGQVLIPLSNIYKTNREGMDTNSR